MTELKTLREIMHYTTPTEKVPSGLCFGKELRDEAKKWIELINTTPEDYVQLPNLYKIGFSHPAEKKSVIAFIKHFFNLEDVR